ncbi:hypothetical protein [Arthrobacter sp. H16F315]|uniref:hypothetical protein n=1 Tax=Arthrobacter sp. H16F315 TaxID=2955314 RepID=UPI0020968CCF|nr:hypothetical protein [Arthrobacter sp. H16F315]
MTPSTHRGNMDTPEVRAGATLYLPVNVPGGHALPWRRPRPPRRGETCGTGLDLPFLRTKAGLILDDRLEPASFAVETSLEDAHFVLEAAREHGLRLHGAEAAAARLERVASQGRSKQDMTAAYYASTQHELGPHAG